MKHQTIFSGLMHLFFPHICPGCGSDVLQTDETICFTCFNQLPFTRFENIPNNKTERIFHGRIGISCATSLLYFTKDSIVQQLMHALKYDGNQQVGLYLGRSMGKTLQASTRFQQIDMIIPLPLFKEKEKKRGYNQSAVLCEGIGLETGLSIITDNVKRTIHTETQTKKHRRERWQNVEGIFEASDRDSLQGKNILLVDDVVTTGATLEACATAILQIPGAKVSIATLAIATH